MIKCIIASGPPGVGKTTVSYRIASMFSHSALINGDAIYDMVVGGYIKPGKNDPVKKRLYDLFIDNLHSLTWNHLSYRNHVVVDWVIPESWIEKIFKCTDSNYPVDIDFRYVVLTASDDKLIERDSLRPPNRRCHDECIKVKAFLHQRTSSRFLLDTNAMTVEEIANTIIKDERFQVCIRDTNQNKETA